MSQSDTAATVLVLVGSLRAVSINRQLAQLAIATAPEPVRVEWFDRLGDLPHYNEDLDTDPTAEPVSALRSAASRADAVLAVTPEYNGSTPGVLKNAIDWLSRPYGNSPVKSKPAAVIGVSLGQYGGLWAHDETRRSLGIAGLRIIDDTALSIPTKTLQGRAPAEVPDVVAAVRGVLGGLAGHAASVAAD